MFDPEPIIMTSGTSSSPQPEARLSERQGHSVFRDGGASLSFTPPSPHDPRILESTTLLRVGLRAVSLVLGQSGCLRADVFQSYDSPIEGFRLVFCAGRKHDSRE